MTIKTMLAAAAAALVLAACGGGGGGEPAPPPVADDGVPASALASTAALVDWGKALPASDSAEPLDLKKAKPPVSDTEEPQLL